jgi:hypothetical protein
VLLTISKLPQSSGRFATGGDSHGQYQASGFPDGALHQCCIPGANNGKNSNGDGGHGGSSGQTTAPTGSNDRTNAPWPTYGHPWQGHMTMYLGLCPLDSSVHRPSWPHWTSTRLPASCLGHTSSRYTSRPPRAQDGTPVSMQARTTSRWPTPSAPWRSICPLPWSRTGWRTPAQRTTPLHQLVIFLLFVIGNGSSLPITSVGDSVLLGPF